MGCYYTRLSEIIERSSGSRRCQRTGDLFVKAEEVKVHRYITSPQLLRTGEHCAPSEVLKVQREIASPYIACKASWILRSARRDTFEKSRSTVIVFLKTVKHCETPECIK